MRRLKLMSALLLLNLILAGVGRAAEFEYPGRGARTTVYYPVTYAQHALQAYYQAYGVWPATWDALIATGVLQTELRSPQGELIEPGDGSIDFRFDLYYDAAATLSDTTGVGPALIRYRSKEAPEAVRTIEVPVRPTYRETLVTFAPRIDREWEPYVTPDALKLMMLAAMMHTAVLTFQLAHGEPPASLEELLASGLSPMDYSSHNPVTGQLLRFDGSPHDLAIISEPGGAGSLGIRIEPVDGSGQPFRILMPY